MTTVIVHTKSESRCVQCDLTVSTAIREGLVVDERPGIDTAERADELADFKTRYGVAAAPIVEVRDESNRIVEVWSGFRPDKIKEYAA